VESEAAPQRIDLGQGKARTIAGIASASTSRTRPARLFDHREIGRREVGQLVLRQAGLAQEAFERLRRRADLARAPWFPR
jgi:hypothetical protein